MHTILQQFGALRIGLAAATVVLLVVVPEPRAPTVLEWPDVVPTLIAPALAPLVLMVLMLDLMMSRIFSSGADTAEKRRLKKITFLNLALAIALVVRWLPFFLALGRPL